MPHQAGKAAGLQTQERIKLDDRSITYAVRISPKAKHIRLEIRPESGLTLVLPRHGSMVRARAFIYEKRRWILRKLARYEQGRRANPGGALKDGDTLPYLGGILRIALETDGTEESVTLDGGKLWVCLPAEKNGLGRAVEAWYRGQAETIIRRKVEKLARRQKVTYVSCALRSQRTLWGSCSPKRNLSFNWRLLMAPEPVVDYVIAHEVAHLSEMNHSKKFWAIVSEQCPQWREHRNWLKDHSGELGARLR